jgi:hypothetical protein
MSHAENIGLILLALQGHEHGDQPMNDPIVTTSERGTAYEFVEALAAMDEDTAAGIVAQQRLKD